MDVEKTGVRRFNWQLALVLVLAVAVLGGTLYGLRKWRRTYMATHALETGTKAFEARDWPKAAQDLGRYIGAHPKDFATILKYATAQMRMYPQKKGNVDEAVKAYRQILRSDPTNPEASDRVAEIYLQIGMPSDAGARDKAAARGEGRPVRPRASRDGAGGAEAVQGSGGGACRRDKGLSIEDQHVPAPGGPGAHARRRRRRQAA